MAVGNVSRGTTLRTVHLNAAHLAYARIRQARGLVQVMNRALIDRSNDADCGELTDPVLQKLAYATNDLLEQAQEAMLSHQPK
ncbi:MAG: hypothetical protein ACREV9_10275 [Burkholderiales bacterium]